MKASFPGSLLVAPLGLALTHKTLPVDVRVTPLAGPQDLPGSWPIKELDMMTVREKEEGGGGGRRGGVGGGDQGRGKGVRGEGKGRG